jgi:hypothetical protein
MRGLHPLRSVVLSAEAFGPAGAAIVLSPLKLDAGKVGVLEFGGAQVRVLKSLRGEDRGEPDSPQVSPFQLGAAQVGPSGSRQTVPSTRFSDWVALHLMIVGER